MASGRPGVRADKRSEILGAAWRVFAADGYAGARIDAIATKAQVSTRTLYKYFPGKDVLFIEVVRVSASTTAEGQLGLVDRYLPEGAEPRAALLAFAQQWVRSGQDEDTWPLHAALMRHMHADADNLPAEAREAWLEHGPRRVVDRIAERLASWGARGELRVKDPDQLAAIFAQLIMPATAPGVRPAVTGGAEAWVAAAVQVFLDGCAPRD